MISCSKKFRALGLVVALALLAQPAFSITGATEAFAGTKTVVATAGSGAHFGPWLAAAAMIPAVSLIACSAIISAHDGRPMTNREAWLSFGIPLGCLLRQHLIE